MIANKHITKIVAVVIAIAVCLCLCATIFYEDIAAATDGTGISMEYETELFDVNQIINVNIIMDDAQWEEMLANATKEVYYQCNVEINGTLFYNVGIRPKGNTSLTSIANDPDTDRYSLKLEFDQYVDGQTCFGLDKLILNNNYADATNMKEALIYDMYRYLGADASLCNYAKISINGEYWGLYLALEAVEDSFMLRNYGTENGKLYKPDGMDFGDMDDKGFHPENMDFPQFQDMPPEGFGAPPFEGEEMPDADSAPNENESKAMPDMKNANFPSMMSGGGANLNYIDDDLDSYSTIWEGEVTSSSDSDHRRVVTALKNISEGANLEKYMDVENLLKYMAVHTFSVNEDSLSGMMAHNYYLYEYDGRLNILPWDYNLALGGMHGGTNATDVVNDGIDDVYSATKFFDALLNNEEYKTQYHSYLQRLSDEYIAVDGFSEFYNRTQKQINALVETDPTAFYSYDEYTKAAQVLYQVVTLRGKSISEQVKGSIPSVSSERKDSDTLVNASQLDLSVMGSMNHGDDMRGFAEKNPPGQANENTQATTNAPPSNGQTPRKSDPSAFSDETTDGDDALRGKFPGEQNAGATPMFGNTMPATDHTTENLIIFGICFVVLIVALVFAMVFHRKPRRK